MHREDDGAAALRARGVDVLTGDLLDDTAVQAALRDVSGAYFVYPVMHSQLIEATVYFAQAAKLAGVQSIVNMSQISAKADAQSRAARALAWRTCVRLERRSGHASETDLFSWSG